MSDRRNLVIAALAALVVLLVGLLVLDRGARREPPPVEPGRTLVAVLDVMLDRDRLRYVDLLFDRPLGEERLGEVLSPAPASLEPETGGVWRWRGSNVLRFEVSGRLHPATAYRIELDAAVLEGETHTLVGDTRFRVVTDQFQVDRVEVREELAPEGERGVRFRGTLFFNYPVDPEELAPRIRLFDPVAADAPLAVELESRHAAAAIPWRSAVVEKAREARELELRIDADLTSARGNVPLRGGFTQTIPLGSGEKLEVRGVEAEPGESESTLRIELSSPVSVEQAKAHLRIEPEIEHSLRRQRNVLVLRGPFRAGESYRVRLSAGLVGIDASELASDWIRSVRVPDLPASVGFESHGMFLSASGARSVVLQTRNVSSVEITIERVYRNNVLYLLEQQAWRVWQEHPGYSDLGRIYGDRLQKKTLKIEGAPNRTLDTSLAIDDLLGDEEPGLYRLVAGRAGQSHDRQQLWVLLTDLGIVAKRGREDVLIWMASFADLSPIPGARIQLLSQQNQVIATGVTDARGLLHLRQLGEALERNAPALIVAETQDDWSFLPLERTRIDTAGLDVAGAASPAAGYDAFLYGERDLYRPGETVRGAAVVRDRDLAIPPQMPMVLRHRDPQGQVRNETRLELNVGIAEFSHALPATARTGHHSLELLVADEVVGRYRFQVEEFVPDRIKVEIAPTATETAAGETLTYEVSSAYLFGPPASELPVESRVRLVPSAFRPPGFEAYSFGNPERKFGPRQILQRETTLDREGRIRLDVEIPSRLEVASGLEAEITARVREHGGRGVAARTRLRVHPYPSYLGLRREEEGHVDPGTPVRVAFVAVTPDGSATAAGALRAEFFEDRWQTVLRRTASGSYRYESNREARLLATQAIEPGATPGHVTFTPPETGSYRVVLSDIDTGASAQLRFYASGWGYAPWAIEEPGRIEVDVAQAEYAVGETAQVQIRAPFSGRLLVTVERERVLHQEIHRLEGNTASISLPIREVYRPNVYVTATLVRSAGALEPGAPGRAFGAAPVAVDRTPHRMQIELVAPEETRPRGPLELSVRAAPGVRLTVAAVDEGILQLVAQETPDPFAHFYRKRALGVGSHDIFALLLPETEGAAAAGGGRARAAEALREQFVRTEGIRRVKPVAFWSGVVRTDAAGRARVAFELPEFQGALRVMAIAHAERDFGATDRQVRVRDPLVLLPTFPRFLSFDEQLKIPVSVRNDTGREGSFSVTLGVEGPARIEGEATKSVTVAHGGEAVLYFGLATAQTPGDLELVLEATGNDERARASVTLGVRADLPPITLEESGSVQEPTLTLAAAAQERFRPEGRRVSLRISPVPLVQLYGKLESLLTYPYGCLEQSVSRAFPLLYVADLARELEPRLFEENDPDALVAEGIRRVASMQLPGGGFALWPRGGAPEAWASIHATHFLVEAERAGHHVPGRVLEDALRFLGGETQTRGRPSGGALERAVYALYVLARAGKADLATMDFIRETHLKGLNASARAQLGAAYAALGNREELERLLAGLSDAERVRRQTGGNFASTTRNRALILLALLEGAPDDTRIPDLADRLARDALLQRGWSTQEAGFALLALGQLFRRQAERADYAGEVWVGGDRVARFGAETSLLDDLPAGPVEIRMDPGYAPGAAFYSLRLRGVPTDAAFAPETAGLELERALLDRGGSSVEEVAQGDLLVLRLRLRSTAGRVQNVAIQNLLPAGLEVENARLSTTESLPWAKSDLAAAYLDIRDDRLLIFADLPDAKWHTTHALLRAVAPGSFRVPPVQAEAMYDGTIRATGERGTLAVKVRR